MPLFFHSLSRSSCFKLKSLFQSVPTSCLFYPPPSSRCSSLTSVLSSSSPLALRLAPKSKGLSLFHGQWTRPYHQWARSDGRFVTYKPVTPGLRHRRDIDLDALGIYQGEPVQGLTFTKARQGGRNHFGRITIRGRGGGPKRILRNVDFERWEEGEQKVLRIEFDPFRSAFLALLQHQTTKALSYIIAPQDLKPGDTVHSFRKGIPETLHHGNDTHGKVNPLFHVGNCLKIRDIPVGSTIHCIGLNETGHAQLCRSAGTSARLLSTSDKKYAHVRLQSGEIRLISLNACATIGTVSNPDWMHRRLGSAGANRARGRRPKVRGVAMNPCDHPHGGGEGKTKGKHPVTPWGVPTKGFRTRKKSKPKWWIVEDRRKAKK
ncbi:hypothetical protein HMI54_000979 [Coelomomyces lativittatus]|nr:hypothetical protein HMI56_007020 [Coelomomyces lativittatus]KAJ1511196.1 hypothetical protein HMI54_000979 [Coelomomyces lativittatus]KAJ1512249.1 hypothetical protein HMI55_006304 [Coelomomyces lativittatus]